ncbi:MAG: hypothetical protein FWE29_01835 [Defluviitaleaceae bacterium]|nr:hypothetical protein [Defluviitaleaceae bacterium]
MKKSLVSLMKKSGEKAAMVPITVRSWPWGPNQPKMPSSLREKMEKYDIK